MNQKVVEVVSEYSGLGQSDWLWEQTPHAFDEWGAIRLLANAPQPDILLMYQFDFARARQTAQAWWSRLRSRSKSQQPLQLTSELRGLPPERIVYLLQEPPLPEVAHINQANYEQARTTMIMSLVLVFLDLLLLPATNLRTIFLHFGDRNSKTINSARDSNMD